MSEAVVNRTASTTGREIFWLIVANLLLQFVGRKLRANGWTDWSSYVVAAACFSFALIPIFREKTLRRKLIGSLRLWLVCLSGIAVVFFVAPFLSHYFPTAVAYGISCFIFLIGFALSSQAFSSKSVFGKGTLYAVGVFAALSFLFGLGWWLVSYIYHH